MWRRKRLVSNNARLSKNACRSRAGGNPYGASRRVMRPLSVARLNRKALRRLAPLTPLPHRDVGGFEMPAKAVGVKQRTAVKKRLSFPRRRGPIRRVDIVSRKLDSLFQGNDAPVGESHPSPITHHPSLAV